MLQKISLGLLATACAIAVPAQAQPAAGSQARPEREPMTREAVEQRAAASFAWLDADGDSQLTPADRDQRREDMAERRFERLDTDSDGAISRTEFAAAGEARAERRAERGEMREGRRGRGMARMARGGGREGMAGRIGGERLLARADADSDGVVSQAEFTSAMLARFDGADADHDGTVSAEERRAQREAMRQRRGPVPRAETR